MISLEEVQGVGPTLAKKLRAVFVISAELLAVQNPVELQAKANIGEGTAVKIVQNARRLLKMDDFRSGIEVERAMREATRLTTGIKALDEHLMGGIEEGSIVEIYGAARGGKTQWCSYFAVRSQLPREEGGLEGRVLWLDTESSFKPWHVRAIAYRYKMDSDEVLGNIEHIPIVLSSQITEKFLTIPQLCAKGDYRLVIVDSLTSLFRVEYTGLDSLRIRQQAINSLLNVMRRTATATKTVFLYTNQVMAHISSYGGNPNQPVGGHILSHGSDYRFYTRRKGAGERILTLNDNAGIPEFTINLVNGWGGFYASKSDMKDIEPEVMSYLVSQGYIIPGAEPLAMSVPAAATDNKEE
ncbi:MAG: AAA family ATPase [Candidatus Thorarchaeota archaeon]